MADRSIEKDDLNVIEVRRFIGRGGEDYGIWRFRARAACCVIGVCAAVDPNSKFIFFCSYDPDIRRRKKWKTVFVTI